VGHALAPAVERVAETREVLLDVIEDAEMGQCEPCRRPSLGRGDRLLPGLEIDVRWGCRSEHEARGGDPHPERVARVQRAVVVQHRDVVARMARARKAFEPDDAIAHDPDVLLRHGDELAPEAVERVAVQPARARLEPRWVDQVGCADDGDVHLKRGVLANECSGGPGVVEVDVGEKEMPDLAELEPSPRKAGLQSRQAGCGTAVEESRAIVRLDEVAADVPRRAEVQEVDRYR
jgi:hypothetical protein